MNEIEQNIINLFQNFFHEKVIKIFLLPQSGSYRKYYRIIGEKNKVIATFNENIAENRAFIYLSQHFSEKKFNVPKIYAVSQDEKYYLQSDLGDIHLYNKQNETEVENLYKRIIQDLIKFQFEGIKNLEIKYLYGAKIFDYKQIWRDLNYFKYFVVKLSKINFNEIKLDQEFEKITQIAENTPRNFFMYRDFQSANILMYNRQPYYIDYQGGMKGAFYYDLASLLFDFKVNLSNEFIEKLKKYYLLQLEQFHSVNKTEFDELFRLFTTIRILQAFAAYAFRGIVEKKMRFINNITKLKKNINTWLKKNFITKEFPELLKTLYKLTQTSTLIPQIDYPKLTIEINSFSYLYDGYPENYEGNGGGFVFDCRFLPNPGRIPEYKNLTGLDEPIAKYLSALPEFEKFMGNTLEIILEALQGYKIKNYNHLQINFGCTGGQHRSVFCAEYFAKLIKKFFNGKIIINHKILKK